MPSQNDENTRSMLDGMAADLKSGVANPPKSAFTTDGETPAGTPDRAGNVVDLASATVRDVAKGASDVGTAASNATSKAVEGTKDAVAGAVANVNHVTVDVEKSAERGLGGIREGVVRNPLKSVLLAAGVGYLAAVLAR